MVSTDLEERMVYVTWNNSRKHAYMLQTTYTYTKGNSIVRRKRNNGVNYERNAKASIVYRSSIIYIHTYIRL